MQLHITHDTIYRYDQAASLIIQALRMWPAASQGQKVKNWRVHVDGKRLQPTCNDGFGNPVATHTIDRSVESVKLSVRGRRGNPRPARCAWRRDGGTSADVLPRQHAPD